MHEKYSISFSARRVLNLILASLVWGASEIGHAAPCTTIDTFSNTNSIAIPASGTAALYPSTVTVAGLGPITPGSGSVRITINNFSHTFPDNVGIVLVGPTGVAYNLQDGAGDSQDMNNVTYTIAEAATALPNSSAWTAGTYGPAVYRADNFPAPGSGHDILQSGRHDLEFCFWGDKSQRNVVALCY